MNACAVKISFVRPSNGSNGRCYFINAQLHKFLSMTTENILQNIQKYNAISVIITIRNDHLISINKNECIKICKKHLHAVKYKMGYYYWTIDNQSETNEFPQENTIKEYGILLPWYDVDTQSNVIYNITPSYTCITSSWMELSEEGYNIPMNVGKEDI